jgi:hypothetical protein
MSYWLKHSPYKSAKRFGFGYSRESDFGFGSGAGPPGPGLSELDSFESSELEWDTGILLSFFR